MCGREHRGHAVGRLQVDGGAGVDQRLNDGEPAGERGDHERGDAVLAAPIGICSLRDEARDVVGVPELRVEQQILGHAGGLDPQLGRALRAVERARD